MGEWQDWTIKTIDRADFPERLKGITNSPEKLFYRGEWNEDIFSRSLTVVGSRRMTKYGQNVVEKFVPSLVANGVSLVSGFMYGIDTVVHQQTLECGGITVAVVGGGLNVLTTSENDLLYSNILKNQGLVISEYEPNFRPTIWSFPQRDRIMSALATLGVLVIEGGIKSGSLITANYAIKQGVDVFAVPGPINSTVSEGTNWLIKSGAAKMATAIEDILDKVLRCPVQNKLFKDFSNLSELELKIVAILESESVTIDELCRLTKSNPVEVSKTISLMLMRDLIEEVAGKFYLS